MMERVLLAVDDSPDALAAARLAVEMASTSHAELRAVHVMADHVLDFALERASGQPASLRRDQSATAVLARVTALANAANVDVQTELLAGDVGGAILDAAQQWHADLVVIGRGARTARGAPYVGAQTRHVLEFADQPVLVVPPPHRG